MRNIEKHQDTSCQHRNPRFQVENINPVLQLPSYPPENSTHFQRGDGYSISYEFDTFPSRIFSSSWPFYMKKKLLPTWVAFLLHILQLRNKRGAIALSETLPYSWRVVTGSKPQETTPSSQFLLWLKETQLYSWPEERTGISHWVVSDSEKTSQIRILSLRSNAHDKLELPSDIVPAHVEWQLKFCLAMVNS